eukprot:tig00000254_g22585.t1
MEAPLKKQIFELMSVRSGFEDMFGDEEHIQGSIVDSAIHVADPTTLKWVSQIRSWKERTSASALAALSANYAQKRVDAPSAKLKKRYKHQESETDDGSESDEDKTAYYDVRDIPDYQRKGHADEGLPLIAGKRLWGLHIGPWLFRSAYPLRLILRASSNDLAIDLAGWCPSVNASFLDKDKPKHGIASSASEDEEEEELSDDDDDNEKNVILKAMSRGIKARGRQHFRLREARWMHRLKLDCGKSAVVYRLRIPFDSVHAAALWTPDAKGGSGALVLDLLRPPAFLSRRPADSDRRKRAFSARGDFTPSAAASGSPRLVVLGDLRELKEACQRALSKSAAFRNAWARGAAPALDPAPGAYPTYLAPREGLTVEALRGLSAADLRAALAAAGPQPPRLHPDAPRAALESLATALLPRAAPAAPAAAPAAPTPASVDAETRRAMVQVLVKRGLLKAADLGPDGLPLPGKKRPALGACPAPPERDNGLGEIPRLSRCFVDHVNHRCKSVEDVERALGRYVDEDMIRFPKDVPEGEREGTAENMLRYGGFGDGYYSFCEGDVVSEDCSWHCPYCHTCRGWKEDHCRWCGECYYSGGPPLLSPSAPFLSPGPSNPLTLLPDPLQPFPSPSPPLPQFDAYPPSPAQVVPDADAQWLLKLADLHRAYAEARQEARDLRGKLRASQLQAAFGGASSSGPAASAADDVAARLQALFSSLGADVDGAEPGMFSAGAGSSSGAKKKKKGIRIRTKK